MYAYTCIVYDRYFYRIDFYPDSELACCKYEGFPGKSCTVFITGDCLAGIL